MRFLKMSIFNQNHRACFFACVRVSIHFFAAVMAFWVGFPVAVDSIDPADSCLGLVVLVLSLFSGVPAVVWEGAVR